MSGFLVSAGVWIEASPARPTCRVARPGRSAHSSRIHPSFEDVASNPATWQGQSVCLARPAARPGRAITSFPDSPSAEDTPAIAVLGESFAGPAYPRQKRSSVSDTLPFPAFNLPPWFPAEAYSTHAPRIPSRGGQASCPLPAWSPSPIWLGQSVSVRVGSPSPGMQRDTLSLVPPLTEPPVAVFQGTVRCLASPPRAGRASGSLPPLQWYYTQTTDSPATWQGQSVRPVRRADRSVPAVHSEAGALLQGHLGHLQITFTAAWSGGVVPPVRSTWPGRTVSFLGAPPALAEPSPFVPYQFVAASGVYPRRPVPQSRDLPTEPVPVGLIVIAGPYRAVAQDLYVAGAVVGEVAQP